MASELIKHITDTSFEADVLQSGQPVLVDYWAEWCGPCRMIAPLLDEVATGYQGKLQVAKMNVDENRDIPAKFGIRGIPTPCCSRMVSLPPPRWAPSTRPSSPPSLTSNWPEYRPDAGLMLALTLG